MPRPHRWTLGPGWRVLLTDAGIDPVNVLRRARLPEDLWARPTASL
ncbi:MAG: AraC family transcriptional regulator, partial [Candidatus Dadabacteria bacterium]